MAESGLRKDQKILLAASAIAFILWIVPIGRVVTLPLVYLNTHIHEFCHALAAVGTGGRAEQIIVYASGSGITPVSGGWLTVIASAGYVGSAIVGAAMLFFSRTERGARATLGVLAAMLTISMVLYVRGDGVGVVSGIAWIAALAAAARYLKGDGAIFAAQFLGIQQCLNAAQSILILLQISAATEAQSDAALMERATHLPSLLWASIWAILSAVLLFLTLRRAWSKAPKAEPSNQTSNVMP